MVNVNTRSSTNQEKPRLSAVIDRIDEISTLPHTAIRVMEVANDPDSGAIDLKEVIETDAALSARILRCVNSSAFAIRTRVTSLQQAIAYLGLNRIRNLAVTASVSELFKSDEKIGPYRRSQLWRHLVSVGICARLIAMRCKINEFEEAFLAGLLHDIGIILEDQYVHEPFSDVLRSLDNATPLATAERGILGFDHTVLGAKVAANWGFPEATKASIRYHHGSVAYRGEHIDIVRCVEMANLLCTLKGISSVGLKLVRISQPALTGLALTREDITVLAGDLDQELSASANLFEI
ncbi:MAG: HDOD domain-containing protein [Planctomycetota bacterium]